MKLLIARQAGELTIPGDKVDKCRLLGALAMVESGGGHNWQPNFEPAFYVGGRYWNDYLAELVNRWGQGADPEMKPWCEKAVACSWGPWQILYVTAEELGYDGPPWGLTAPAVCLEYAIRLLNRRVIPKVQAETEHGFVAQIADGYNTGNPRDGNVPTRYITKVLRWYDNPADMLPRLVSL
jgi:hypothetical protein